MTTLGRRTPATPEHAGCVSGVSRISNKETASPAHPGCVKRVAVQRDALGAGAYWLNLREKRPPARRLLQARGAHAVDPASSATATRRPPQAPDVPPRARTTACYAFL